MQFISKLFIENATDPNWKEGKLSDLVAVKYLVKTIRNLMADVIDCIMALVA